MTTIRHPRKGVPNNPPGAVALSCLTSNFQPPTSAFIFNHLRTLLHSRDSQPLSLQSLPHSWHKTPGGGVTPNPESFSFCFNSVPFWNRASSKDANPERASRVEGS